MSGWVVLDKAADMTSTQAVGAVRRLFDAAKAGHAGTLDPLATGLLPIALDAYVSVPMRIEAWVGRSRGAEEPIAALEAGEEAAT